MKTTSLIWLFGFLGAPGMVAAADPIPMPRPLELEGLHAYAEKIITAGETIHFRVSSTVPYQLSIARLGHKIDDPNGDQVLYSFPEAAPVEQPIQPGSFVHVAKALPALVPLEALSLECWVRPWRLTGWQTLISQYDYPTRCGFGLFIAPEGEIQFYLGDGGEYRKDLVHTGPKLTHRQWCHVVGTWDGTTKGLWIDGQRVGQWPCDGPVAPGESPIRLAACGHDGNVTNILDGDLAMPVIYDRVLTPQEIADRFEQRALQQPSSGGLLACWPFGEEQGDVVADASAHQRDGRIVNVATWMIGGPSFDGTAVPRFGSYDPVQDPQRGHGLRFASDDLYDCRWKTTHEVSIPESALSGFYVGRFRFEIDRVPRTYHVAFVVRKHDAAPKAPILAIASTNSWLAYKATPFAVTPPGLLYHWGTGGISNSRGNPPAYCMYRNHQAGQPAYKVGIHTPWPNAGPYVLYAQGGAGYSHLLRAERFALVWLEQSGYAYDMVGDLDVHRNPERLDGYKTILINGHGEYWSAKAYEGLDRYLCNGGTVIVLSGNALFWRVSFNDDCTVMECRKLGTRIGGRPGASVGEIWHTQDKRRGSILRECGYPAWKLIGLDTFGWWGIGPTDFGLYRVEQPQHFLFHEPEAVAVEKGTLFGGAPNGGLPRSVGHECDIRLSLHRQRTSEVPSGTTIPTEPQGIVTLANGMLPRSNGMDYFMRPIQFDDGIVANMIYWERPQGGRVFHTGSLGSGWGLSADPEFQTLIRNVLAHFGVKPQRP
ncbi:MAG: N,N-dimethylformamidase beta subunit family domain-containing protein [Pirellulaceae bacterium]